MTIEIWKPVPDYPRYMASNLGNILLINGHKGKNVTKLVYQWHNKRSRYMCVKMYHDGKETTKGVHQIIASAFHGICPEGMEVNHIDRDTLNNNADNLSYVTRQENLEHRDLSKNRRRRTLTKEDIQKILELLGIGKTEKEIAEAMDISIIPVKVVKLTSEVLSPKQEVVLV